MGKSAIIKLKKNIKYSICSCGKSNKLPYCDNKHREINKQKNSSYKSVKVLLKNKRLILTCSNWEEQDG